MQRIPNPELDRLILDTLATKYKLREKREGVHLSTLVYCLTKSFLDSTGNPEPTDEEVMLFSLGYGLQEVITPKDAEDSVLLEKDGIVYRPDFVIPTSKTELGEIKTTRVSLKKNKAALPETWVEYMMGGCYIRGTTTYNLAGLYILGDYAPPFPQIYSETLVFTEDELKSNWGILLGRKRIYTRGIKLSSPPEPFQYCKSWECKNCRHHIECDGLVYAHTQGLIKFSMEEADE